MLTPTNLSRLAAWCNFGVDTHRHLYHYDEADGTYTLQRLPDPTDPGADPQIVDDVWLARVMWTLRELDRMPEVWGCATDTGPDPFGASIDDNDLDYQYAESHTLALLLAARAAGVPEVVEIMGDES
jgi:hypothetical protein